MDFCFEDESQFFDAREDIAISDSDFPDCDVPTGSQFDIWVRNPRSVQERRSKFFDWLGLSTGKVSDENSASSCDSAAMADRLTKGNGSRPRSLGSEGDFSSSRSTMSSSSGSDLEFCVDTSFRENFMCRTGNWDNAAVCIDAELSEDGELGEDKEVGSHMSGLIKNLERSSGLTSPSRSVLHDGKADSSRLEGSGKSMKKWWLRKLRSFSCVMEEGERQSENSDSLRWTRPQRVKARQCGKKCRELSALYLGQDFQAHEGSILVMKFSPDGHYLASAGEDGIVRVWKVVEDERSNEVDIPYTDPLCLHFTMNHHSELNPSYAEKERVGKAKSWSRSSDSACVIVPPKVFRLLEKPLHEYKGHHGEILDLSWSISNFLLSSSVDKTVRLWRVGFDNCLKVFSHNDYVTCIQFNPIDDNYFMSGSIDGKLRIWEIYGCRVASWTDTKDIVTAVSYRPDGQGALVGSIAGYCRFYTISDNQLVLDDRICIRSKKKSSGKRIIRFQYFPLDPCKVMVTCADSQVRILKGLDVIGKYKGPRSSANYLSASFTADGKHIVSACEDSNVYIWNCANYDDQDSSHARKIRSFERFPSTASLAIPWNGFQAVNIGSRCPFGSPSDRVTSGLPLPSPALFSLEQEFFLESFYNKGSQTWPEENLPASAHLGMISSLHKSEYKFLRACQSVSSPSIWGLVILTAGWDGKIRSFHNYGLPVPH